MAELAPVKTPAPSAPASTANGAQPERTLTRAETRLVDILSVLANKAEEGVQRATERGDTPLAERWQHAASLAADVAAQLKFGALPLPEATARAKGIDELVEGAAREERAGLHPTGYESRGAPPKQSVGTAAAMDAPKGAGVTLRGQINVTTRVGVDEANLQVLGFEATRPDGTPDPESIKAFQRSVSLPETGRIDANTQRELRAQAAQWQSVIRAHGGDVGKIDGMLGPVSMGGLLAVQEKAGLEPTGRLDDVTRAYLLAGKLPQAGGELFTEAPWPGVDTPAEQPVLEAAEEQPTSVPPANDLPTRVWPGKADELRVTPNQQVAMAGKYPIYETLERDTKEGPVRRAGLAVANREVPGELFRELATPGPGSRDVRIKLAHWLQTMDPPVLVKGDEPGPVIEALIQAARSQSHAA